jgi:hypothetical protein
VRRGRVLPERPHLDRAEAQARIRTVAIYSLIGRRCLHLNRMVSRPRQVGNVDRVRLAELGACDVSMMRVERALSAPVVARSNSQAPISRRTSPDHAGVPPRVGSFEFTGAKRSTAGHNQT